MSRLFPADKPESDEYTLTDDGVDAETSLSLSLHLYLSSPPLHFFSHAHLWSLKLSLKMRVSSNELFSILKNILFML